METVLSNSNRAGKRTQRASVVKQYMSALPGTTISQYTKMKIYKSNQRRPKSISKNQVKKVIKDFCESTSLHGYSYLNIANSTVSKLIWTLIILAMTGLGSYFFVKNTNDYINARLVTNIETSSANLSVSNK